MIYYKLALKNIKKHFADFKLYFTSLVLSYSLILSVSLFALSLEHSSLTADFMNNTLLIVMLTTFFLGIILVILFCYLIKQMIKKRSKEIGIYLASGISKKHVINILVAENIILSFVAILISILIGYTLSLILSSMLFNSLSSMLNPESLSSTFIFRDKMGLLVSLGIFLIILIVTSLKILVLITRTSISDILLINKDRLVLNAKFRWYHLVISILSIATSFISLQVLTEYIIFDGSYGNFINIFSDTIFISFSLILVLSISLFIYSITYIILGISSLINKFIKSKYQMIITKNYANKSARSSVSLVFVTGFLTVILVSLNIMGYVSRIDEFRNSIDYYSFTITSKNNLAEYKDILLKNIEVEEDHEFSLYAVDMTKRNKDKENYQIPYSTDNFILESDYNKLAKMASLEEVKLNNSYIVLGISEYANYLPDIKVDITVNPVIINGKKLVFQDGMRNDVLSMIYRSCYQSNSANAGETIIVPDDFKDDLVKLNDNYVVNTKGEVSMFVYDVLYNHQASKTNIEGHMLIDDTYFMSRSNDLNEAKGISLTITYLIIYLVLFLILITGIILRSLFISDVTYLKREYNILSKLGVNEGSLTKINFSIELIYYLVPLIYPLVISYLSCIILDRKLFYLSDFGVSRDTFIGSSLLVLFVYLIFFVSTFFSFKRKLEEKDENLNYRG